MSSYLNQFNYLFMLGFKLQRHKEFLSQKKKKKKAQRVCMTYSFFLFFPIKKEFVWHNQKLKKAISIFCFTIHLTISDKKVKSFRKSRIKLLEQSHQSMNSFAKYKKQFVGAEVQNLCILGPGLVRAQINKYWILILIHEPELPRR